MVAEGGQALPVVTEEADLLEYFATHQHLRVEIFRAGRFILSQQPPRSWQKSIIATIDPSLADRIVGGLTRLTEDGRTGLWFTLPGATGGCGSLAGGV